VAILLEQEVDGFLAFFVAGKRDFAQLFPDQIDDLVFEDAGEPGARAGIARIAGLAAIAASRVSCTASSACSSECNWRRATRNR